MLDRVVPAAVDDGGDWLDVLRRTELAPAREGGGIVRLPAGSRRRAWYALAAAALLTMLVVNPAFGIGSRILDWFEDSPAPERVQHNLDAMNEAVGIFEREGAAVIAERARGVTATETDYGWVYLWAAPMEGGGWCVYAETPSEGEQTAVADCQAGAPDEPLLVMQSSKEYDDGTLRLLAGRTDPPIRSLEMRFGDGSTDTIPLVSRFFLYNVGEEREPVVLLARDTAGGIVAQKPIRFGDPGD